MNDVTTRLGRVSRLVVGIGVTLLIVGSASGVALAGGKGAHTQTVHAHGAAANDLLVVDFLPIDSPPGIALPSGCWMPMTDALMSVNGNLIEHETDNKTGDWFTATFTGEAAVYPIVFASPGVPKLDANGNDVLDTSGPAEATGHLTLWDGGADNNKNSVQHATLTFKGTDASGNAVSLRGHFQFATNAAGQLTATVASLSC